MTSVRGDPLSGGDGPVVVAHRGFGADNADYRENTPSAVTAGVAAGARWVEVDGRLSADGVVVCHHDGVLPDGRHISQVAAGDLAAAGVATLEEVLAALPAHVGLDLEIKSTLTDALAAPADTTAGRAARLAERWCGDRAVVTSFDPGTVSRVRAVSGLPTGLITFPFIGASDAVAAAAGMGCAALGISVDSLLDRGFPFGPPVEPDEVARAIDVARRAGVWVVAWVPTAEESVRLAELGVDAVCVDDVADTVGALAAEA